jgi:exopolyphosphatase/guanosine-5'-triphosphate,3'-diphosphate pyrophosphatase
MSTLRITFAAASISFEVEDQSASIPVGPTTLRADIRRDPPAPEELTNAIGLVMDHMEDVEREAPAVWFADAVEIAGLGISAVAAVEEGRAPTMPLPVSVEAIEDIFRTVVTESAVERALNPGLSPEMVEPIVGVTCALVGVLRFLRPTSVSLVET